MQLKIEDVGLFKAIFRGITRFTDTANFEITKSGIRIRSIDPHDFCYVDIKLSPSFFQEFSWNGEAFSASAEIGSFKSILPNITKDKAFNLEINNKNLSLNLVDGGNTKYTLDWLEDDTFDLPEPFKLKYDVEITIPSSEFFEIIKEAAGVSREICFELKNKKLFVSSSNRGFSYSKEISLDNSFSTFSSSANEKSYTIIDYLRTLSEIIMLCGDVKLSIKEDLPVRLDLSYRGRGHFTFIIANRKLTDSDEKVRKRHELVHKSPFLTKPTLSQISVTKFPKFIKLIDSKDGISVQEIKLSKYETSQNLYTRLAELINFITKKNDRFYLTDDGKKFVKLLDADSRTLEPKLNKHLIKTIPEYSHMLKYLSKSPMSPEDLLDKMLSNKTQNSVIETKDDVLLLLGLATWCNAIERKTGLYYFSK